MKTPKIFSLSEARQLWIRYYLNQTKTHHSSKAFTLVELLAVIAIVGLLVGMFLPAVQQVREAARRTSCLDNLRQCGLAILYYEGSMGHFPSSTDARLPTWWRGSHHHSNHSWRSRILPFLEQQAVYDAIKFDQSATLPCNQAVGELVIETYRCSSYSGNAYSQASEYRDLTSADESTGRTRYAISNYVSMGAVFDHSLWITDRSPEKMGLIHPESKVTASNVLDGLSNTIMLVESREEDFSVWIDGRTSAYFSNLNGVPALNQSPYYEWQVNAAWGPSSEHSNGANHVFGDGSVRLVNNAVTLEIYQAMTTFHGSELIYD